MSRKIIVDIVESDDPAEIGFMFAPEDPDDNDRPTAAEIIDALTDVLLQWQHGLPIIIDRKNDA